MLNTGEIYSALRSRYSGKAWAFLTEVPDGTGSAKRRSADAMAMSLWPSRGLELQGFEIKVSRSDWLRELKMPEKAESICGYCDRWWVVVGDESIVKLEELPPTWGLMVPRGKGIIQRKEAPALKPCPVDRVFLAGLLRRAMEQLVPDDQLAQIKREQYDLGKKHGGNEYELKRAQEELEALKGALADFQKRSGIEISRWGSVSVAETLRLISSAQQKMTTELQLSQILHRELEHVQILEKALEGIRAIEPEKMLKAV